MRGWLRDVALIAAFDLGESVRSRRALVFLLLYVAGAAGAALLFLDGLAELERSFASALHVAPTDRPGAMTSALLQSQEFLELVGRLVGDDDVARFLVGLPPLALYYGWLALALVPILVIFTSSDAIASEVASGSCRYALFRVERSAWAVGKLGGQALLMAAGVLLGAAAVWVVGLVQMASFAAGETALWLLILSGRAWIFGFAWLGVALGTSQLVRSVHWARGLCLLVNIGGAVLGNLLLSPFLLDRMGALAPTLGQLYPGAHKVDLWRPVWSDRAPAEIMLICLGITAFSLGHARFARRDA